MTDSGWRVLRLVDDAIDHQQIELLLSEIDVQAMLSRRDMAFRQREEQPAVGSTYDS